MNLRYKLFAYHHSVKCVTGVRSWVSTFQHNRRQHE